jgi:predicted ester cyclase
MAQETIMFARNVDIAKQMNPGPERLQSLQGFDADYTDIVNYIVRCTHKIWEEGGIGLIYTHYLHNAKMHTADGWFLGRDQVVADTIQTLSAFPDRRAYAESVVWTGNDQDGFYTNHIALSVQHNTGYSVYGPPTGRKVMRFAQCICFVKENFICEEWVLMDEIGVIRQLGLDLDETVARLAQRAAARPLQNYGDLERMVGQYAPEALPAKTNPVTGFDVDDFLRRNLHEIWNRRMFNVIREVYYENYEYHGPAQRDLYGRGEYTALVLSLLAAFPDARFSIDQLYWQGDEQTGYRTSMRWSLVGTHTGDGIYGEPTGIRFRFWGLTQHVIKDGKLVEEWTLFNEFSLLKQLYLARQAKKQS